MIFDMENDPAMFQRSDFGSGIGNVISEAERPAEVIAFPEDESRFVAAAERLILPSAGGGIAPM